MADINSKQTKEAAKTEPTLSLDAVSGPKGLPDVGAMLGDVLKNTPTHHSIREAVKALDALRDPYYVQLVKQDPARAVTLRDTACKKIDQAMDANDKRPVLPENEEAMVRRVNQSLEGVKQQNLADADVIVQQIEKLNNALTKYL